MASNYQIHLLHFISSAKQRWSKDVSIYSNSSANVNDQCPIKYPTSINDVFAILEPPTKPNYDQEHSERESILINHVFYIDSEQQKRVQLLVSETGCRRSKVAFTSLFLEDSCAEHGRVRNIQQGV